MSSLCEGFEVATTEAMAVVFPMLHSLKGAFYKTIHRGETGYGCDVDIEDFVAKAISILDDPEDLLRVAANGRARVLTELSLSSHGWQQQILIALISLNSDEIAG